MGGKEIVLFSKLYNILCYNHAIVSNKNKILVFIDDSGDPGFKFDKGSSIFFVISAIIFNDTLEVEKTALAIKTLRRDLGFSDNEEFKFNKSRKEVRLRFLGVVRPFNFKIRAIVFDKRVIRSDKLIRDRNSFYSYAIKLLLKNSNDSILDASIRLDGSGDRTFKRSFVSYLRKNLNSNNKKILNNFKFVDSKESVLIQLVDMVAGSIRRSYEDKGREKGIYKSIIKKHIEDEWQFE
jgi:hypothetical protein